MVIKDEGKEDKHQNGPIVERIEGIDRSGKTFSGTEVTLTVPDEHPIVERPPRPDWLWEMPRSMLPGTPEARREIMDYIEWLERMDGRLRTAVVIAKERWAYLENELHQSCVIIEGLKAERDRAEQFAKDIEKGQTVSQKSLEREIDI